MIVTPPARAASNETPPPGRSQLLDVGSALRQAFEGGHTKGHGSVVLGHFPEYLAALDLSDT